MFARGHLEIDGPLVRVRILERLRHRECPNGEVQHFVGCSSYPLNYNKKDIRIYMF